MSLQNTNLVIQMAPIPATFKGTPGDLATTMVRRMKIVSPSGTAFIYTGDTEPTSNVGPWLKDGTKWYVWSEDIKRYVPLDITDSELTWYWIGPNVPASSSPALWLRTSKSATEDDPTYGTAYGWYLFDGTTWNPFDDIVRSGTTAQRPGNPIEYQKYYDTDISVLLWWERNAWRTVSGVPGDIKMVAYETLLEAITHNPGWEVLGAGNEAIRGRGISQATKDAAGSGGSTSLSVGVGIPERQAYEVYDTTNKFKIDNTGTGIPLPFPAGIAFWHLVKL